MKKISFIALILAFCMIFCCACNVVSGDLSSTVVSSSEQVGAPIKGSKDEPESSDKSNSSSGSSSNKGFSEKAEITKVKTKDYVIDAKGSNYATGIKLPKLTKKQAKITYMTNTTYDFIMSESTKENPTAIAEAMKIWKEVYGVDVEIELVDWDNFTSHLITSVAAGEGPDVMRFVNGRPKWVANNLVATLEDKIDMTDKDFDTDYMQEEYAMNGHIYAVNSIGKDMPGGTVLAYNKTKFQNAGIEDPMSLYKKGKWTYSQFVKTAKAMTNAAEDEYGLASYAQLSPSALSIMSLNKNGTINLHLKDEKVIKKFGVIWKIFREDNSARRTDEYRNSFPLGKDAMAFTTMATYCSMMDTVKKNNISNKFGVVPAPVWDVVGDKNPIGSKSVYDYGFAMSSVPKNQEGAVEFLRLLVKVSANISRAQGEFGQAASYLSSEEKNVFKNVKYEKPDGHIATDAIDGTNIPIYEYLRKPIYINTSTTDSLSAILTNANATLSAVIEEYEINAGLR